MKLAHSTLFRCMAIEEGYFEDEGIDLNAGLLALGSKTMTANLREADIGFMSSRKASIYTYNEVRKIMW